MQPAALTAVQPAVMLSYMIDISSKTISRQRLKLTMDTGRTPRRRGSYEDFSRVKLALQPRMYRLGDVEHLTRISPTSAKSYFQHFCV